MAVIVADRSELARNAPADRKAQRRRARRIVTGALIRS
jgi:hypothetical protein